jgi:hypothetical protein
MRKSYLMTGILALVFLVGCQEDPMSSGNMATDESVDLRTVETAIAAAQLDGATVNGFVADLFNPVAAKNGAQLGGMIWADGELFRTVGTPTSFSGDHGNFDKLFTGTTFKDGIGAISESKPGDRDYNGGRWDLYTLKAGVTTDYSNATSVDDLDLSDFESAATYFECPLRPMRGNGHR